MKNRYVTTILRLCSGLFILTCSQSLFANEKDLPKTIADGLVLKEDAKVDIAYARPNVDWSKFKTVYIRTLKVTDEAKDTTPKRKPKTRGHLRESWIIPEKDIQLMQSTFTKIMKESLIKEGISVVDVIQSDSLVIVPTIEDIYLNAAIEKSRDNHASRGGVFTKGAGSMTLSAIFADGSDMRIVAYAVDNKYPSSMWSRNTRIQNMSDMRRLFRSWGKKLAESIGKMKKNKK